MLAATRAAKVEKPLPYLFACALVANAASFVLPISNPANLVLFGGHMPPLRQWLALFGVDVETWPRALWYRLASLIANVSELSCSENGCAFVLGVLLGLPVAKWRYYPSLAVLPSSALSRLGGDASRLGVDLLLGDAVEDLAVAEVELGPVSLDVYQRFAETTEGADLLHRVLELIMPVSSSYEVRWSVEDRRQAPRLGVPAANSRLGINTHMGSALPGLPFGGTRDGAGEETVPRGQEAVGGQG